MTPMPTAEVLGIEELAVASTDDVPPAVGDEPFPTICMILPACISLSCG